MPDSESSGDFSEEIEDVVDVKPLVGRRTRRKTARPQRFRDEAAEAAADAKGAAVPRKRAGDKGRARDAPKRAARQGRKGPVPGPAPAGPPAAAGAAQGASAAAEPPAAAAAGAAAGAGAGGAAQAGGGAAAAAAAAATAPAAAPADAAPRREDEDVGVPPADYTLRDIIRLTKRGSRMSLGARTQLKRKAPEKAAADDSVVRPDGTVAARDEIVPAPQVEVVDGRVVLDPQSLVVTTRSAEEITAGFDVVYEGSNYVTSASYSNRTQSDPWTPDETNRFYSAVRQYGIDFSMIATLFPKRKRREIKLKFKREERANPEAMEAAINARDPIDFSLVPPEIAIDAEGGGSGGQGVGEQGSEAGGAQQQEEEEEEDNALAPAGTQATDAAAGATQATAAAVVQGTPAPE